jgi:hypothetical protein
MATISIWRGYRSFTGDNNYEVATFNGSEIGSVRFNIDGDDIQYRVFRTETGSVVIYFIERRGYDCSAEVYEYDNLEEAKEHYAFILRRAGVI